MIVHPSNPDIVWIAALGSPFGPNAERGIFKTTDGGKTWKKTLFVNDQTGGRVLAINYSNPNELYAGMYRGLRLGWDIVSGGPATEGGIYKSTDGGETWNKLSAGLPQKLIGKIDLDVARSNPRVVYAMVEAPGPEGGLYKSDDAGATWRNINNNPRLRARPFYFHYVDVNPKNENEVWVNELALHKSTDGGKTFTQVATPHGDNHGIWFNPDNPSIALQCNDGGANVTLDGGRSWSSILNQPTAELYMVSVDEQFPYRLYAPQQDNSTIIVPSLPPHSWGYDNPAQSWTQGPGCETGQIHPRPDGSVIWGACKGEVGRYNVATGQEKHSWIYPQNRYGHDPDDIKYRFPRQTVIHVSPHDPKTVYQASHVLHRTTDEGVTWTTISPDLTAREPDKQIVPGSPITRDITGEEVYSSIYSMVESRLERGVLWVGANDGPVHVSRDGGKNWANVTPKDLPPGGRVQNIEDSPHRKGSAYIAVYRFLREHDLKPYIYVTNDYGKTWSKLTDGAQRDPDRPSHARRPRGSGPAGSALCRHRVRIRRVVRQRPPLAVAPAEPAGDAGHRHPRPPQGSRRRNDGAIVLDHGQRDAPAAAGRRDIDDDREWEWRGRSSDRPNGQSTVYSCNRLANAPRGVGRLARRAGISGTGRAHRLPPRGGAIGRREARDPRREGDRCPDHPAAVSHAARRRTGHARVPPRRTGRGARHEGRP